MPTRPPFISVPLTLPLACEKLTVPPPTLRPTSPPAARVPETLPVAWLVVTVPPLLTPTRPPAFAICVGIPGIETVPVPVAVTAVSAYEARTVPPVLEPTSAPTLYKPVTLPPINPTLLIVAVPIAPNRPAFGLVGVFTVSPPTVCPSPSKDPVKAVVPLPTGTKPAPLFQPDVADASILLPSA